MDCADGCKENDYLVFRLASVYETWGWTAFREVLDFWPLSLGNSLILPHAFHLSLLYPVLFYPLATRRTCSNGNRILNVAYEVFNSKHGDYISDLEWTQNIHECELALSPCLLSIF